MNKFLEIMGVTFRRDPSNFRPRINKLDSMLDREQKISGNYFSLEEWADNHFKRCTNSTNNLLIRWFMFCMLF